MKHTDEAFQSLAVGDKVYLAYTSDQKPKLRIGTCMKITPTGQVTVETKSANGTRLISLRFDSKGNEIGTYKYARSGWTVFTKDKYTEIRDRLIRNHKETWDKTQAAIDELSVSISKVGFSAGQLKEALDNIKLLSTRTTGKRP